MTRSPRSRPAAAPLALTLLAASLMAGCQDDTKTVVRDKVVDVPHVDDQSTAEQFAAHLIAPPDNVDDLFATVPAPAVSGTTAREPDPSLITDFGHYPVNSDLLLTRGRLNHTHGEAIISAEFNLGGSLSLVPINRSRGQLSFERTTDSANHAIDQGDNIILAVNADPYSMLEAWNIGLIKTDGMTYTGFGDRTEEAVVVYQDGRAAILDQVPPFTLNVYVDGAAHGELGLVHRYHPGNQTNTSFRRGNGEHGLYPGDGYRGTLDLSGKQAVLIRAEVNGVSVVQEPGGSVMAQLPPLSGKVVRRLDGVRGFVIPNGHAVLEDDGDLNNGAQIDIRYETTDPSWDEVQYALGAGFGRGLMVRNGEIAEDSDEGSGGVNSRTAFGIRADGSYFFLVVDKPAGSLTDGITTRKMAQLMVAYGAQTAVNFDGGGSTTLVGRLPGERYTHLLNTPSDGSERVTATKWGLALNADAAQYGQDVAVYPREITLLADSVYRRFRGVGYDSQSWQGAGPVPEYGISDARLGGIDPRTGAFKAGKDNAEGYVVVQVGEQKGAARVTVTRSVDSVSFAATSVTVDGGASLTLQPTLTYQGKPVHYSLDALAFSVDQPELCRIDAATGVLTAANTQGQQCQVTARVGDAAAQLTVNIGVAPVVVADFEGDVSAFKAAGARHSSVTLEQVTDPVFKGQYSMKLSWTADPKQPGTFGAYLTDPSKTTALSGYPKYLGVNVYIPEELAGKVWWVRGTLVDADGKNITINYNNDGDPLPERGWNFMKAEIPAGFTPPLRFNQPFRFLVLKTAERIDSHVLLDDFMEVYSDNTDLAGPGVTTEPAALATVDTAAPTLTLQAHDDSGLDVSSLTLLIDGDDVSGAVSYNGSDRFSYSTNPLSDGWHRVDYRIADRNGNMTAGDYLFQVDTGGAQIRFDSEGVQFFPGATASIPVTVQGGNAFQDFTLRLEYDRTKADLEWLDGSLPAQQVSHQDGVWEARFSGFNDAVTTLGTLQLAVKDYLQNTAVSVVISGSLNGKPFYHPVLRKEVGSRYRLLTEWGVRGQATRLLVTDAAGQPAAGVEVETFKYNAANDVISDVVPLGRTDADGQLMVTLDPGPQSAPQLFRAFDDDGASLMSEVNALVERLDATPRYPQLTPGHDGSSVNVTWYTDSHTLDSTVRYGQGGLSDSAVGESEIVPFFYGAEAGVVRVHHALLTGLAAGTEYQYQVPGGALHRFTTDDEDDAINLHLFGDTQTSANTNVQSGSGLVTELLGKMQGQLPSKDLILHVGDISDDLSLHHLMRLFFEALEGDSGMASRLWVPTQGNHEVINEGAYKFASMFRMPQVDNGLPAPYDRAVYSFDYGPMHMAVLSSEVPSDADWQTMMDWLRRDMAASDKTWKVVMIHRPPYHGNPASGNGRVQQWLPPVVDELGIDLVLSGHDHMYSRSLPLQGGQPHPQGATYLIAGSDSAKFYDSNGTGIARVAAVLFDDNVPTYTTLEIKGAQLRVLTRTVDGRLVDDALLTPRAQR
ncbi:phosphodiester glycosidase family protein [Isoalcanivorax beigongshangi]|uniref:Phosphodiester glycosidase family protein n=1 Tax=Isoalcanivorax beigongshangi TaxID=3238810 RepID=A0ABV4AI77_9GAMM